MADTNEEQLLSDLLRGIALEDARLEAPHLESRVLASAFAPTEPSFGGTRRFSSTIAAAAVMAVLLPVAFWWNTQAPKTAGRAVETTEAAVAEKPAVAIAGTVSTGTHRREAAFVAHAANATGNHHASS